MHSFFVEIVAAIESVVCEQLEKPAPHTFQRVVIPPRLVVRHSCGGSPRQRILPGLW